MLRQLTSASRRLLHSEAAVIGLLALGTLASDALLLPAIVLAFLYWPLRMAATGRISRPLPAGGALVLLLLLLPVTLWATAAPLTTLPQIARLLLGILLLCALVNGLATAPGALRWAVGALLLVAGGLALLLLLLPQAGSAALPLARTRPANPNVLGGALALLLPLPVGLLLFAWSRLAQAERVVVALALLLALPALLVTRSRGGILALALAVLLLLAVRWRRLAWGGLVALLASLLLLPVIGGVRPILEQLLVGSDTSGLAERLAIWQRALLMVRDFSFTGIGMGQFGPLLDTVYPLTTARSGIIPHAHNLLLQVAVDLGVVGLLAWLTVWLAVVLAGLAGWRKARAAADDRLSAALAGLLAAQLVLFVHGMLDAPLWGTRPAILVWAVWGVLVALAASTKHAQPAARAGPQ